MGSDWRARVHHAGEGGVTARAEHNPKRDPNKPKRDVLDGGGALRGFWCGQAGEKRLISLCVGCGNQIHDQYILRVSPDLEWHAACLKCAECNQYLDETCTCFVRDGKTYCKRDYIRYAIYTGEEEKLEPSSFLFHRFKCKFLYKQNRVREQLATVWDPPEDFGNASCDPNKVGNPPPLPKTDPGLRALGYGAPAGFSSAVTVQRVWLVSLRVGSVKPPGAAAPYRGLWLNRARFGTPCCLLMGILFLPSPCLTAEPISARQPALRPHVHKQPEKTTRVRTVLNEKQLHTLRTCYAANPRPDALMKEQLVEMTGLSPRVIRVWFQNKRCKDKKRSIMMKQLQQQQPNDKTNIQGMTGTPMVAAIFRHAASEEIRFPFAQWQAAACFPPLAHQAHSGSCSTAARAVCIILPLELLSCFNQVNFSEGGPGSNSTGSEVASMSSQLPDTPNSMVASPIEA
nr:PREDICTED: insulin gene enhancer protein ISL-1 [Opisthocomus hoazin]